MHLDTFRKIDTGASKVRCTWSLLGMCFFMYFRASHTRCTDIPQFNLLKSPALRSALMHRSASSLLYRNFFSQFSFLAYSFSPFTIIINDPNFPFKSVSDLRVLLWGRTHHRYRTLLSLYRSPTEEREALPLILIYRPPHPTNSYIRCNLVIIG